MPQLYPSLPKGKKSKHITAVSGFPDDPEPFDRIYNSQLPHTLWTWNPSAGPSGEWWGDNILNQHFNVNGVLPPNSAFRINGTSAPPGRGIMIQSEYRIIEVVGEWWGNPQGGTLQVRDDNTTNMRSIPLGNNKFVKFYCPVKQPQWVVGEKGVIHGITIFYTGSNGLTGPFVNLSAREVWLP